MKTPKVIVLDIETAPLKSFHYRMFDENIGVKQICDEWFILSFCAKTLGEDEVLYVDAMRSVKLGPNGGDLPVLKELHTVLDEADIVITQNGVKFDMKKIRARMVMNKLPPFSPVRVIDTYQIAKRVFGFTSNGMEWMAKNLTHRRKMTDRKFQGFLLSMECLAGNPAAWQENQAYNIDDVLATEAIYMELRPWSSGHPNMYTYRGETPTQACPKCASTDVVQRGYQYMNAAKYQRYCCKVCGAWSRGKTNLLPKDGRVNTLMELT